MLNAIKPKTRTVVLYLMVPVAMFIFTVFVPLITAFVYSFFEWKGGPQKNLHRNRELHKAFCGRYLLGSVRT